MCKRIDNNYRLIYCNMCTSHMLETLFNLTLKKVIDPIIIIVFIICFNIDFDFKIYSKPALFRNFKSNN